MCEANKNKKPLVPPKPGKSVGASAFRPVPKPRKVVKNEAESSSEILPERGTPEFCLYMYQNNIVPPGNWSVFTPDKNVKQWKLEQKGKPAYTLKPVNQSTYKAIERLVLNTWEPSKLGQGRDAQGLNELGFKSLKITKIERIENLTVYEQYCQKRQQLFHKAGEGIFYYIFSSFLACLFQRKSRAVVIARSSSSLCKNFNIAHYSKRIKCINIEYLLIMTRCSCMTRGITLKAIFLELCPFFSSKKFQIE